MSALLAPLDFVNAILNAQFEALAEASGFLTVDKARYVVCLLLAYPVGLLFRHLPNVPALKVRSSTF